ncbi:cbb3-type cytochrome c oxidase subunit I [Opitutus terrae]|uniref:Cytochrome c oxidase, subunit I n=1 Tax=Opitutus terrae (strain DSM 11246 / JCM 15787 / PB90-1) TaxID=452637 RepID=B1ZZD0_OPITP|nr:cbb3-type cytochrome c oxidase subunit I [Opitutus terrae]ACB77202.1 cytochrome c oxidase, subunit I [Opitutus terrae PB90-1]
MTSAQTEISEVDSTARFPLSLLLAFAVLWALAGGALALLNYAQTLDPALLADCALLTYGRVRGMQETALVYGWAGNAGFAVALWLLGRLSGAPLRSLNWVVVGTLFWNFGVALAIGGIAGGHGTSIVLLRMPAYVQWFLLAAFAAIAVPGVLAWTGRAHKPMFAAQWYAVAALFLFPWLFSAAHVMLVVAPLRGVLQPVAEAWFAQSLWTLWMAPVALAAAYYLVPKITGRAIPSYDFAGLGFWTLLVIGAWTGGRHLIGGPVPAWIATIGIVACAVLTFHYLVVAINLSGAFRRSGFTLKFVAFGVAAYVLGGFADAVLSLRSVAEVTQFTWMSQAQSQLALLGAFSMIVTGAIYFLVPRIANQPWVSTPLIRAHYAAAVIGVIALVGGLAAAGIVQGRDLNNAAVALVDIATHTRPWLLVAAAGQALLLVGNLVLAAHLVRLWTTKPETPAAELIREPHAMEASAS